MIDLASKPSTEAQAVAMLTAKPEIVDINGAKVLINPNGESKILLDLMEKPLRMKGFPMLRDIDSFVRYAKAKAEAGSEIFLSADGCIGAKLYIDAAGFRQFGALYRPVETKSFEDWIAKSGQKATQEEFATFIERHIDDIHSGEGMPTAADLLTFCSTIEDKRQVTFKKSVSLQDGRVELVFAEKTSDAQEQKLKLFREFQLALRPYQDDQTAYAVTAALRFRIHDGQITFWYELKGLEAILEKIRAEIKTKLEASGLPVYLADVE